MYKSVKESEGNNSLRSRNCDYNNWDTARKWSEHIVGGDSWKSFVLEHVATASILLHVLCFPQDDSNIWILDAELYEKDLWIKLDVIIAQYFRQN